MQIAQWRRQIFIHFCFVNPDRILCVMKLKWFDREMKQDIANTIASLSRTLYIVYYTVCIWFNDLFPTYNKSAADNFKNTEAHFWIESRKIVERIVANWSLWAISPFGTMFSKDVSCKCVGMGYILTHLPQITFENFGAKGENAHDKQFHLLPQSFHLYSIIILSFIDFFHIFEVVCCRFVVCVGMGEYIPEE